MPEKKPNRISMALAGSEGPRAPLARELGEVDENPAEEGGAGVDEAAKKEAGARLRAALSANDDAGIYDAVCRIYDLEESGAGEPEDGELPY